MSAKVTVWPVGGWDYYRCTVDNVEASIYVDLDLGRKAPVKGLTLFMAVKVHLQSPSNQGFTTQTEAKVMYAIEDAFLDRDEKQKELIYVGRLTGNNQRVFYFYGASREVLQETAEEVMQGFPDYAFDLEGGSDPEWDVFFESIYPNEKGYSYIRTRRVIEALRDAGDRGAVVRPVSHFAYFDSEAQGGKFREEAAGLEPREITLKKESGEKPWCVTVVKDQPAEMDQILEVAYQLGDLARSRGGHYDGWETKVIKG